jgi:type III pantothenate kinase
VRRWLIDAGNTNIKLARVDGDDWSPVVSIPRHLASELPHYLSEYRSAEVVQVWASNVAGLDVARQISDACAQRNWPLVFIAAQTAQCGVRNRYGRSDQLGSDRWAALIAAWHRVGSACLVVSSGTATTIDALTANGEFAGGLILPGIELMQRSLAIGTAQLAVAAGAYADFPRNTNDAIYSGAIQATCGAIQRQHALLENNAPVLLCGGAAPLLTPHLSAQIVDNLVLQGLLLIAKEADKA